MPGPIICTTNQVDYSTIRQSMGRGVRTPEQAKEAVGVCLECDTCQEKLTGVLATGCTSNQVPLSAIVEAVQNGADTVEKVSEITGSSTKCGRCKSIVANVIELGY